MEEVEEGVFRNLIAPEGISASAAVQKVETVQTKGILAGPVLLIHPAAGEAMDLTTERSGLFVKKKAGIKPSFLFILTSVT